MTQDINNVIDVYINKKFFDLLSDEEKNSFRESLQKSYEENIATAILQSLPEPLNKKFIEVAESGNEVELQEFIESNIPNFKNIIEDETLKFLNSLTNSTENEEITSIL